MKAQIRRLDFTKLIGKIQSVVPIKPSIPILANILIEAENDQIILSATDLNVSIKVFGDAQVTEQGAITLPAKRLFQLVRELTVPEIKIETTSPETVILHAGNSHFRIQGMHKTEFPNFPDLSEGYTLSIQAKTLHEMLTRTAFAAAREDTRQVLNGILMEKLENIARFVATDGKRLARNQLPLENLSSEEGMYVLPLKGVEEIIKLLDTEEEFVKVTFMQEKIAIECENTVLITKLLLGPYPDVSRVIPQKSDNAVSLHREELISLLRQLALFTSENNNSVRFSFKPGFLHLTVANGELGEGNVSMAANYEGPPLEIAFNPYYFLDILRHCKDETIQLEVSGPYDPGKITDSSRAEFMIMPKRL